MSNAANATERKMANSTKDARTGLIRRPSGALCSGEGFADVTANDLCLKHGSTDATIDDVATEFVAEMDALSVGVESYSGALRILRETLAKVRAGTYVPYQTW
jgi:hypothetical protein